MSQQQQQEGRRRGRGRGRQQGGIGSTSTSTGGIGTFVSVAVVAYGVYQAANWAWSAWNEQDSSDPRSQQAIPSPSSSSSSPSSRPNHRRQRQIQRQLLSLRRQRVSRCREETANAYGDFLPALKRLIDDYTNTSTQTATLKQLRNTKNGTLNHQQQQQQQQQQHSNNQSTTSDNHIDGDVDVDNNNKTNQQQQQQQQEKDLWETIKVQAVTRMIATAYAHTILFLVLHLQVHLFGGKLFREQQQIQQQTNTNTNTNTNVQIPIHNSKTSNAADDSLATDSALSTTTNTNATMNSYQSSHRLVLQHTYDYFFQTGIFLLLQSVQRAVQRVLTVDSDHNSNDHASPWDVTSPSSLNITQTHFDNAIQQIRTIMEGSSYVPTTTPTTKANHRTPTKKFPHRSLLRFLVPPEHTANTNTTTAPTTATSHRSQPIDPLAQSILDETQDLLESPVFEDAQYDSLQQVFFTLQQNGWGTIFTPPSPQHPTNIHIHSRRKEQEKELQSQLQLNDQQQQQQQQQQTLITKPLAYIITKLKTASNSFYKKKKNNPLPRYSGEPKNVQQRPNIYIEQLERLPTVLELGDVSFD